MLHARNVNRDIRGKRCGHGDDGRIAELAGRQHGVVTRSQLASLGVSADAFDRRLRTSRLLPRYRSVYAVGHQNRSRETTWMAAVLAGGASAFLSYRSAAAHWGVRRASGGTIDVTTPGWERPRRGIRFHRSQLPPDEVTVKDAIPVTTAPRTLFDLAAILDQRQLERAINEAEVLGLTDELSLADLLDRYPRRPGTRNLRAVLEKRSAGSTYTRSDLEEMFLRFAAEAGLLRPETNVRIEGLEVDCVWREQRLIIEVDGWATHRTRAAFERDRRKSRMLQTAGWRYVPVTFLQLRDDHRDLARDVRRLLATATLAA
jgi:very-short-patch-repair endonuclease/predicted transcriptional regulator of viral defense system